MTGIPLESREMMISFDMISGYVNHSMFLRIDIQRMH